ncbi:MAG: hypothetical protein R3F35_11005 [Myxococcota bacterium]
MGESNRSDEAARTGSYCAHCLGPVEPQRRSCPGCGAGFYGSGRFDLLGGGQPSREFAFLFRADRPV